MSTTSSLPLSEQTAVLAILADIIGNRSLTNAHPTPEETAQMQEVIDRCKAGGVSWLGVPYADRTDPFAYLLRVFGTTTRGFHFVPLGTLRDEPLFRNRQAAAYKAREQVHVDKLRAMVAARPISAATEVSLIETAEMEAIMNLATKQGFERLFLPYRAHAPAMGYLIKVAQTLNVRYPSLFTVTNGREDEIGFLSRKLGSSQVRERLSA